MVAQMPLLANCKQQSPSKKTKNKLDVRHFYRHIVGVKIVPTSLALAAILGLTLSSCKPESIDPQRLSFILDQNAQLKQSIIDMQGMIAKAGEEDPSINDRIEQVEKDIKASLQELDELSEEENQAQIRTLELETRLTQFRADFETMQKQVSKAATN